MSETARERQAAIHEAAHAVSAYLLGWGIHFVSIVPDAAWKGHTKLEPREAEPLIEAAENITVSLVGDLAVLAAVRDGEALAVEEMEVSEEELAEILASPALREALTGYVARSDLGQAEIAASEVCETELEAGLLLAFCRERARRMIEDPIFRALVERLVFLLVEAKELDGGVVMTELSRAEFALELEESAAA